MTKAQIKTLTEADDQLQWWAMILFSEICELVETEKHGGYDAKTVYPLIASKTREFDRLVIQRATEIAEGKTKGMLSLEQRVEKLESIIQPQQES